MVCSRPSPRPAVHLLYRPAAEYIDYWFVRVQAGLAEDRLQRLRLNIHGRQPTPCRPQETFVQIDCIGKVTHDVVVHIGLYIEDHEINIIYVICQPIRRNPLHYALAGRIRIRLHDLKTP